MISHKYRCIFVHIPKSAGTSIAHKLDLHAHGRKRAHDHRSIKALRPVDARLLLEFYRKDNVRLLCQKLNYKFREGRPGVSESQFQEYFKFTFIRNPWARVHSWHRNILNDSQHMLTYDVPENASLAWFVQNRISTLLPQVEYIRDWHADPALDFIGRYENLYSDFAHVCSELGVADPTLPQKMRIGTPLYTESYDQHSIDLVATHFKEDIRRFGFEYGETLQKVS